MLDKSADLGLQEQELTRVHRLVHSPVLCGVDAFLFLAYRAIVPEFLPAFCRMEAIYFCADIEEVTTCATTDT